MKRITVNAENEKEAIRICKEKYGWTPDTVREVDSGEDGIKAFMCFENWYDAALWDNQK